MKKRYYSIDILKLIMAICVVAIHVQPFYARQDVCWYKFYKSLIYLAVPCFFLITGYFLGQKLNENKNDSIIILQLKKYVKLYVILTAVYLPLTVYGYMCNNFSIRFSVLVFLKNFFFLGENYNSWILWYLLSTIYAFIFLWLARRFNGLLKNAIIIIVCIFAISVTKFSMNEMHLADGISSFYGVICKVFHTGRLATGLFYINLGMCISKVAVKHKTKITCLISFIIGLLIEANALQSGYAYEIARAICSVSLFVIVLGINIEESEKMRQIGIIVRKLSSYIYYSHLWIWSILSILLYGENTYGMSMFFLTIVVSVSISLTYIIIQNKRKLTVKIGR